MILGQQAILTTLTEMIAISSLLTNGKTLLKTKNYPFSPLLCSSSRGLSFLAIVPFCSNILFREFALISMWRVPAMPIGAHALLSLLAEPLKQLSELPNSLEDYVSENLKEFQDWVCVMYISLSFIFFVDSDI